MKAFANLKDSPLGKQLQKASQLSTQIFKDIETVKINDDIPQPIIDKSIKFGSQISELVEGMNQLKTKTEQIDKQTKPPTKHEKRMNLLKGFCFGIVCSVIGGVILFFLLQ